MLKNGKLVRVGVLFAALAGASLPAALAGASTASGKDEKTTRPMNIAPPRVVRRVVRTRSLVSYVETITTDSGCVMRVLPSHPTFNMPCSNMDSMDPASSPGSFGPSGTAAE